MQILSLILISFATNPFVMIDYGCGNYCIETEKYLMDQGYTIVDQSTIERELNKNCETQICKIDLAKQTSAQYLATLQDNCIFMINLKSEGKEKYHCLPKKSVFENNNITEGKDVVLSLPEDNKKEYVSEVTQFQTEQYNKLKPYRFTDSMMWTIGTISTILLLVEAGLYINNDKSFSQDANYRYTHYEYFKPQVGEACMIATSILLTSTLVYAIVRNFQ